jgi:hypothetical protein
MFQQRRISLVAINDPTKETNKMGMSTLQIWITSEGSPCTISERDDHDNTPWQVAVMHCDGRVLTWCGRRYVGLVAPCGHLEIKVPPGCYIIRAGEGMGVDKKGGLTGNHLSDHAVVTACCDESICVMLFAPTLHNCVFGVNAAIDRAVAANVVPAELARPALAALKALAEKLPASDFDKAALPVMNELLAGADKPLKGK